MRALVTGGAGFIGSHLVEALLEIGFEVLVVDNLSTGRLENLDSCIERIEFIQDDISLSNFIEQKFNNIDVIFHLAALADIVPSIENPDSYFASNVIGTFNVLQIGRRLGVSKIVYAASSSCYGLPDSFPTNETAAIKPQYPYALTKRLGEEMVIHWGELYGLNTTSLRFFNVYGERSRTSGTYGAVMGVFLAQKLSGVPFTIVGDGSQRRDFTYVRDVVSAIITAAKSNDSGKVYNVGSGASVSINHLVELLGGDKVHIPKRPGEPDCTYADISKIKNELGWSPQYSLEKGLERVLQNIDYWKTAPVWTPESISIATKEWFRYLGGKEAPRLKK
jgi:UDP-glucose 4-epimerase